jgi:hypothetical protein
MNAEEFKALSKEPGYVALSYEEIKAVIDSVEGAAPKAFALEMLLKKHGLDTSQPNSVAKYEGAKMYLLRQSEKGEMLTPDYFNEY